MEKDSSEDMILEIFLIGTHCYIQAGGTWMINFPHQHGAMKFNILHKHADTLLFLHITLI